MLIKKMFLRNISKKDKETYEEAILERIDKVITIRANSVIPLLLVIELFLIAIFDISNIVEFGLFEQYGIHYLSLHTLIVVITIILYMYSHNCFKIKSMWIFKKISFSAFVTFMSLVFLSCIAMITGLDQIKNGSTTIFVFFILIIAMYILLRPKYMIIVLIGSYIVFLVGQLLFQNDNVVLLSNITNVTFAVIVSFVISYASYNNYFDFTYTAIKLEETTRKLELLSTTDQLTMIYNRRKFDRNLETEISRSNRNKLLFSLLMIDIDYFKEVNDSFGHQVGDEILKEFSKIIQDGIRFEDTFARFGGEEFVLILFNCTVEQAQLKAEQIRTTVKNEIFNSGVNITVSIGVTQYDLLDTSITVVNRADKALYKAKDAGRDKVITILK